MNGPERPLGETPPSAYGFRWDGVLAQVISQLRFSWTVPSVGVEAYARWLRISQARDA